MLYEVITDTYEIMEAKVGKDTYYRLRVGAFKARTESNDFCTELKKVKIECYSAQKK